MNCIKQTVGLILLLLCSCLLSAQNNPIFSGGWQDGYGSETFTMPESNSIFYGGWRDGFAEQRLIIGENNNIFTGGSDDGFTEGFFIMTTNNGIFSGGWQDGFAQATFTPTVNNSIFAGGWQDGFSEAVYAEESNNSIFSGGWQDGFSEEKFEEASGNLIFSGGWQDGFSENKFEQAGNNSIFSGGWQDGFAEEFFMQMENNSIFSGGWQDGFSESKFEDASNNGIFFGGWQDGFAEAFFEEASNNSIFAGGFQDGFSEFSIEQNPANILPVELLLLSAHLEGNVAMVEWSTAVEINSDYFDVERSLNAIDFETVGWLPAAGNSTNVIDYLYPDDVGGFMTQEVIYYRLKQWDLDGSFNYYGPVAVELPQSVHQPSIYPNPNDGRFQLSFMEVPETAYDLVVWDATGREVYREKVKKGGAQKVKSLDLSYLASGTYICEVTTAQDRFTEQLIILKD